MSALNVLAQETNTSRQIYNQAESEYDIGRFDQAIHLLQAYLPDFEGNLKQSAYRLLALCYLSQEQDEKARQYAEQLVKMNNYYNSAEDPARFQDLISQLKGGLVTTITTASSQSESINEAPVPITIITAQMIEELGYNKNLAQILTAYVPGMAEITTRNEGENMAMHGAFSMNQELILIMENGHRLNSRLNNNGPISYSISTDKIDHIEVLRGPASSLYGNVALSAVVNIITKSGRTQNGVKAKYGYANYNTHKADLSMGTQFMDADIFAWASIYSSDGQIRSSKDGKGYLASFFDKNDVEDDYGSYFKTTYYIPDKMYIGGYKDTPSYDVGLTFKLKGFDLMFSQKNVKNTALFTMFDGGYNYDRFYPINGIKPGYGTEETHAEIGYTLQLKDLYLNGSVYSDWYNISDYSVTFDSIYKIRPVWDFDSEDFYKHDEEGNVVTEEYIEGGRGSFTQYKEHTIGGVLKGSMNYRLGQMKGNVLAGMQYEHFSVRSSFDLTITNYHVIDDGTLRNVDMLTAGNEKNLSFFIQDKHYLLSQLILNAGFRYDLKYRQKEDAVNTFSPRLALMYVPSERFSLKLCYSEAFADLSFYYRYLADSDEFQIEPQHLSAVQLTVMGNMPSMHLNYELNLFYNNYSNLLCWDARDYGQEENRGKNEGRLTNIGIEGTAKYAYNRLSGYLSLYYCKDTSSEHYYYSIADKKVADVPHFTLNLHGAWKLLQQKNHELKVYAHSSYNGRKLNYKYSYDEVGNIQIGDYYVDACLLFDLGIQYRYRQRLQLSLDCENICNTDHYICGPNYQDAPHFKRGRSLMASVSYKF
jgi:iron complex outermembrane receptor protein